MISQITNSNCSVCGEAVDTNYCGNCGQLIGRKESTLSSMTYDALKNFLDLDKSAFASLWLVVKRPGVIISNYWRGNRNFYPGPFKMLIYALAIAAIHLSYFNQEILGASISSEGIKSHLVFWIIFFPLLTLTSVTSFIGKKQKFSKHLISVVYISSSWFIIMTLFQDFVYLIFNNLDFGSIYILLFLEIVFFWNARVFESDTNIGRLILAWTIQNLVFATIVLISILLLYWANIYKIDSTV